MLRHRAIRRSILLQALGVWVLLLVFAVINGLFRQMVLEPHLGPEPAHFLSTTTLAGFVLATSFFFVGFGDEDPAKPELLAIGMLWAALTVLLELGLGLARGISSADLFRDYDFTRGGLFGMVILAELLSPPLVGFLRRLGK